MIYLLLPAYDEEESLDVLIPRIDEFMRKNLPMEYHVIACDDGSTDRTSEMLQHYQRKIPMTILTHIINRGLGETSRDLFEKAAEMSEDGDIIIRMDCDDTHDPKHIMGLVSKIQEGYDVVIASRFVKGGGQKGVNLYRETISWLANKFMKFFFPIKGLKEYSCGFRAYRAEIIKRAIDLYGNNFIQLKGLGFTCTLEKIVKLKMLGASFGESPFVLRYDQKQSSSKMVSSITTLGYIMLVILYYWPWGGWRGYYPELARSDNR